MPREGFILRLLRLLRFNPNSLFINPLAGTCTTAAPRCSGLLKCKLKCKESIRSGGLSWTTSKLWGREIWNSGNFIRENGEFSRVKPRTTWCDCTVGTAWADAYLLKENISSHLWQEWDSHFESCRISAGFDQLESKAYRYQRNHSNSFTFCDASLRKGAVPELARPYPNSRSGGRSWNLLVRILNLRWWYGIWRIYLVALTGNIIVYSPFRPSARARRSAPEIF